MLIHVVERGETVYGLAKSYRTKPEEIVRVNGLASPDQLVAGQALMIPVNALGHEVLAGESLFDIAAAYGIRLNDLIHANPGLVHPYLIRPGQRLSLPALGGSRPVTVNAYAYPNADQEALAGWLPYLTYLCLFSYQVHADGTFDDIDDAAVREQAAQAGTAVKMVITNLTNEGFDPELAHQILSNQEAMDHIGRQTLALLRERGYIGVDIDFERIRGEDRDLYTAFLNGMSRLLNEQGYLVSTAVPPVSEAITWHPGYDYQGIGAAVNEVTLMTYDWGHRAGPPMAVAPLSEVERVVRYAVALIPPEKLLLGIPNYGFDWTLPFVAGSPARTISHPQAVRIAAENNAAIQFDQNTASPYFTYRDSQNREHEVWFEDARSIQAKLGLVREYGLKGVSFWAAGTPFPQAAALIDQIYEIQR